MDLFNNRELAFLIWAIALLIFCVSNSKIRALINPVIKAFCERAIITIFAFMFLYIIFIIFCLNQAGLWGLDQLKNTVIWTTSVAVVSIFNINSISEDPHYFKHAIAQNLKLLVFIEFLVSFYTFSLILELLIIPVTAVVSAMLAIAPTNTKYKTVENLLNNLLALFGLTLIVHASYKFINGFEAFLATGALVDFSIPPLLSILFLPFIYFLSLFMNYENVFLRVSRFIKNPSILRYAKLKAIVIFNVNVEQLKRWSSNLVYEAINTKDDVNRSIQKLREMIDAEENPREVPPSEGWSPYLAKNFLKEDELPTGYYSPCSGDRWHAMSKYLEVGGEILPNNISYYVDGDGYAAKTLKLLLNINHPDLAQKAHETFLSKAKTLYKNALNAELPKELESSIISGKDKQISLKGKNITVSKSEWYPGENKGYDFKFMIEKK